jgi:hypothetical protein
MRVDEPLRHCWPETLQDLLDLVREAEAAPQRARLRASGSHWALSEAAVTREWIVETNLLNRTIYDVVPGGLTPEARDSLLSQPTQPASAYLPGFNWYHVEAGVKIHHLYCRLDGSDPRFPLPWRELAGSWPALTGAWALPTLGGAGGQSIAGAISTGTHGGDVSSPPISDCVDAIHLVGAGGRHYWLERVDQRLSNGIVRDQVLQAQYPGIEIRRDHLLFNAALVSVGRMGIIYSFVLRVFRQFGLTEERRRDVWSASVLTRLRTGAEFVRFDDRRITHHFLEVVLNPYRKDGDHTCWVRTRSQGLPPEMPRGRAVRCGNPDRPEPMDPDFFTELCKFGRAAPILIGLIGAARGAAGLALAIPLFGPIVETILNRLADALTLLLVEDPSRDLGETIVRLLDIAQAFGRTDLIVEMNEAILNGQVGPRPEGPRTDVSYAMMDFADYTADCYKAVSLELAFDAQNPATYTWIDTVFLPLLRSAADAGVLLAGYVSLRFTGRSSAYLALQQWARTVHIEFSLLKGTDVTAQINLLRTVQRLTAAAGGIVHWGQQNDLTIPEVRAGFGPMLDAWRSGLAAVSRNGALGTFSSDFCSQRGLDVIQPVIARFAASPAYSCPGEPVTLSWQLADNPPGTVAVLTEFRPDGTENVEPSLALSADSRALMAAEGRTAFLLELFCSNGVETRQAQQAVRIFVIGRGATHRFQGMASRGEVDGVPRWILRASLDPAEWSARIRAGNIEIMPGSASFFLRKIGGGPDLLLRLGLGGVELLSPTIMAGDWLLYGANPGHEGSAPFFGATVRMRCG